MNTSDVNEAIRQKYGQAALGVESEAGNCYGNRTSGGQLACDPITSNLYDPAQKDELPDTAIKASLACGNPTALAELQADEVVLDLGSGGGIDVLLSARRVGPTGKAYGLDMTDEMLALAEENERKSGLTNIEFKAKSRTSRFPTSRWMWLSPTASSTFPVTRIVCSKKLFVCSNRAAVLLSLM
jgi:arsenite methyltransferase